MNWFWFFLAVWGCISVVTAVAAQMFKKTWKRVPLVFLVLLFLPVTILVLGVLRYRDRRSNRGRPG